MRCPAGQARGLKAFPPYACCPLLIVIPAKAGIHGGMDPGLRRDDNQGAPLVIRKAFE